MSPLQKRNFKKRKFLRRFSPKAIKNFIRRQYDHADAKKRKMMRIRRRKHQKIEEMRKKG